MATPSAHFNLTKPATTDYYDIAVVNANTDIIDTQMYNNQVSAAKVMVGATAQDDGESGRVPAPQAGDQNKYLKADGTWDTPAGGSDVTITPALSTGTKIADYEIGGTTGALYAPAGGGGSETKRYIGQLIERVSVSDTRITSSSNGSGQDAWYAFNGVLSTDLRNPNNSWCSATNTTNQWIQYHFDTAYYFTQLVVKCFSDYSSDWVGNVKVEGSNDGTTWTGILASGATTFELTAGLMTETDVTITLDDTDTWEYIRFTAVEAMSVAYAPSLLIDEIYVYGGIVENNIARAEEMTLSDYNALTEAEKNDGTIRFIPKNLYGSTTPVDMSSITNLSESQVTITPSSDSIVLDFNREVSNSIGGTFYISTAIDVTNYDYITYDLVTGDCYNSLHSDTNPLKDLGIGLVQAAPSSWQYPPNVNWVKWNKYEVTDVNSTFSDQVIDVSDLTGTYYILVSFVAWEATISNLNIATSGGTPSQIKFMSKTYAEVDVTSIDFTALTSQQITDLKTALGIS